MSLFDHLKPAYTPNSYERAIHIRLSAEKKRLRVFSCAGRANGKSLTQSELYAQLQREVFRITRPADISKPEITLDTIKRTLAELDAERKRTEELGELLHEYIRKKVAAESLKTWISTYNPYWEPTVRHDDYIFNAPLVYGQKLIEGFDYVFVKDDQA